MPEPALSVAVTGATGTLGAAVLPLLEADPRVGRVVGVARRPPAGGGAGPSKVHHRRGDVRDPAALAQAFRGADVVVHLAFIVTGATSAAEARAINVDGTLNALRAAAGAGARRFVYTSSVAAYGFHRDNPEGMTEEWPTRPADRLFYAREKAELEELLRAEAVHHPDLDVFRLRPSIVLGAHTVGSKARLPAGLDRLRPALGWVARLATRPPIPVPVLVPDIPVQVVHEDDVGRAILDCVVGAGPPGAYNVAADGLLSAPEILRTLGYTAIPVPPGIAREPARALASLASVRFVPPAVAWAEALTHPAIMDTTKAREVLGWRPRCTAQEALAAALASSARTAS